MDKLKSSTINILESLLTFALGKLVTVGGFQGWLIKFLSKDVIFEMIGKPFIKKTLNGAGYVYDKIDGKYDVRKLNKAKGGGDEDAYNSTVRDILG